MSSHFLKLLIIKIPFVKQITLYLTRNNPKIFLYHRFTNEKLITGVESHSFRWQLEQIKKTHQTMSMSQYLSECKRGNPPKSVVIVTVDDGYKDFYSVAYPLLKEAEVAATLYIATAYMDSKRWFWWDKLKYIIINTRQKEIDILHSGATFHINLTSMKDEYQAFEKLSAYYMRLKESDKDSFLDAVAESMIVTIPPIPTKEYELMSWDDVKEVSSAEIEIGSHSSKHRILTQIEEDKGFEEDIAASKRSILEQANITVDTFAYPNGQLPDYNQSIINCVRENGFSGAVVAHDEPIGIDALYAINRMTISNSKTNFLWKLYGFHHITIKIKNLIN